jgi:hypothetical protein
MVFFFTSLLVVEEIISTIESISYKHSRKKALKHAVLLLSAPLRSRLVYDSVHQKFEEELEKVVAEKLLAKEEEKQKLYLERQAKRAEIREIKKEEQKKLAKERELARRKAKAYAEIKAKDAAEKD